MSEEAYNDLNEEFEKWNPMKKDYLDTKFNVYDSGPGASLDPALQPAALAKNQNGTGEKVNPYLIFKQLPKGMTAKSIRNLCERHGQVKEVDHVHRTQSIFVKFHNIADMEAVHRAFVQNEYGFKVLIGKHFLDGGKRNIEIPQNLGFEKDSVIRSSPASSTVNMEKRTIRPSGKRPERPNLTKENLNEFNDQNLALTEKDPLRNICKEDDSHGLERANVDVPKIEAKEGDQYVYRTGRACLKLHEKLKQDLLEAHKKSNGTYDAAKDQYCTNVANGKENLRTIHKCVVCNVPADISCYRCNPKLHIYCGKKCQNVDWEEHRKICGRKNNIQIDSTPQKSHDPDSNDKFSPSSSTTSRNLSKNLQTPTNMERSPSFSSSSSQNDSLTSKSFPKPDMPAPNSVVVMTAVNKTNLVFVRSKSKEENLKFFDTISKIQASAKNLKPLKRMPEVGEAVIAKFQNSHEFGRALILKVTDANNIKLNFLDYGNIEVQTFSNLYRAPKEFIELPRFAIPVILKDVPTYYMTNEVRSFMYSYLRNIDLILKYDGEEDLIPINNVYQVDLHDEATNQHLNKMIAKFCKPQEPKKSDEIVTVHNLEVMPLPVGKDIEYYVMDNSELKVGCLSCTTKEFALEIEKFSDDIQRYGNGSKLKCYAPRQDELCIAKYSLDGLWYRGRCLEKVGDGKPTIVFFDYGNIEFVKVNDIRPYPVKFSWPIYTADFGIDGLPEKISEKLIEKLENLLPCCYPIKCDVVEKVEENFYSITLNSVIQKLKDEDLLN